MNAVKGIIDYTVLHRIDICNQIHPVVSYFFMSRQSSFPCSVEDTLVAKFRVSL